MCYTSITMKDQFVISDFTSVYKGTANFCTSQYFETFLDSIDDLELYSHIKFNNDVMQIPPIVTFVKYRQSKGDELFNKPMSKTDKRCLGACFGYLFRFILKYKQPVSTWVGEKTTDIKNASYFIEQQIQ